jgi:crotonobetainyl-CoA:carnitine CoA-transferase CaiB-like acyl-CoA transferase
VNLLGSLLAGLVNQASAYLNAGVMPGRLGNEHPSIAPYQTVPAADRPIAVAVGNDRQWQRMAEVLDGSGSEPPLAADPRFLTNPERVRHRRELAEALAVRTRLRPAEFWVERLGEAGVPCGLVNRIDEAFALAEALGLSPVVRQERGAIEVASVANPVALSRTPVSYRLPPPGQPTA